MSDNLTDGYYVTFTAANQPMELVELVGGKWYRREDGEPCRDPREIGYTLRPLSPAPVGDANRWEDAIRSMVTFLVGPSAPFDIKQVVDTVRAFAKCDGNGDPINGKRVGFLTAPVADARDAEITALKADLDEQCRINVIGGSREAKLMAEVERLTGEVIDAKTALLTMHTEAQVHEELINDLREWANTYPVSMFGEPDTPKIKEALKAAGMTIDAFSASICRWLLGQLTERLDRASEKKEPSNGE